MNKKFNPELEIPFIDSVQIGYPSGPYKLKKNYRFEATLKYIGLSRGRSSVVFKFSDEKGNNYEMFATDFDQMVVGKEIDLNAVSGTFYFIKRGQNFGIKIEAKK